MKSFDKKVVVITGGSSGIGRGLCMEASARGSIVIIGDINLTDAEAVAKDICKRGGAAHACLVNVADEKSVENLLEFTLEKYHRLDYMFNNAGINISSDARDLNLQHWRQIIDVNQWGVIYGTMAAYKIMTAQGYGHIVNTASMAGLLPVPTSIPYSTTKHALVGLSLALRLEAADLGIKVSVVCPGYVQSKIYQSPAILNIPREKMISKRPIKLMDPEQAARKILDGVSRNQALIIFPNYGRILWWLYRLNASLLDPIGYKMIREFRRLRDNTSIE